jgi:two-component system cell cycle response regulator DivK
MTVPDRPRILLISDSPEEREMYAASFQRDGYWTLQADSAEAGLRLAAELPPAAIVTDAQLAGAEGGLALSRRIRQDAALRRVPVVILTGYVFTHDREAAARAGCDRFVSKPCLPDALSKVVAGLLDDRP